MSEQTGEKTEQPTDKKLKDARKRGQVAKSQDVGSTGTLLFMFVYLYLTGNFYLKEIKELFFMVPNYYEADFMKAYTEIATGCMINFMVLTIPMALGVALFAIGINYAMIGPVFSFEPMKPELNKLNPKEGAKKIFNKKNLFEFIKNVLKTCFLAYLIYRVIIYVIDPLLKIPFAGIGALFAVLKPILEIFMVIVAVAYIIVAVIDYFFQKQQFTKEMMMTKDEVKREYKEMEGDPIIKGERKALHQELATQDTVQNTKNASSLVTNPTHYAVAVFYEEGVVKVPVITAKGKDHVAKMMIKIAQEEDIPIMRDVDLARSLYTLDAWNYVPKDLLEPVSVVLKWAKEMKSGTN